MGNSEKRPFDLHVACRAKLWNPERGKREMFIKRQLCRNRITVNEYSICNKFLSRRHERRSEL